jgi:hypothetical protein
MARSILICGDTKEGKTTQLGLIALWAYKKYGAKTKLITSDGGGSDIFYDMGLIEQGIVDHYDLFSSEYPIATLARLSKGYWPKDGIVKSTPDYMVDFSQPTIYMFDSLTGCAELLTQHASRPDIKVGFNLGTISDEDGYKYGTLAEGHYAIVHKEIRAAFEINFKRLPLVYFVVTARLDKSEGYNNQSKYFPKTIGRAIASDIPSWFQDCYHISTHVVSSETIKRQLGVSIETDGEVETKVLWFKTHKDPKSGIEYPCGFRIAPIGLPLIERKYQEGFAVLSVDKGITNWLEDLEKAANWVKSKVKGELTKNE